MIIYQSAGHPSHQFLKLRQSLNYVGSGKEFRSPAQVYKHNYPLEPQFGRTQALAVLGETLWRGPHSEGDRQSRSSAKSLELRACTSLARLWQKQDKRTEARQLLSEICGWFTEGFATADLREAASLLEELS